MSHNDRLAVILGFLALYAAFLIQMVVVCGPTRAQRNACNATCSEFGAKGEVLTGALVFFQKRDAKCSCTIKDVQTIARDGTVVR